MMKTKASGINRIGVRLAAVALAIPLMCSDPAQAKEGGFHFTERIHPEDSEMLFVLIPTPAAPATAADEPALIRSIRIEQDGQVLQTLKDFEASPRIEGESLHGFIIEDLNFDGYKDLRLTEFLPAGPNVPYLVWLYDIDQQRFVKTELFANITSPEVDAKKRQIITHWRDGAARYGTSYYEFRRGRLVLVRVELKEYENEARYRLIVRELRDLEMVEVENRVVEGAAEAEN